MRGVEVACKLSYNVIREIVIAVKALAALSARSEEAVGSPSGNGIPGLLAAEDIAPYLWHVTGRGRITAAHNLMMNLWGVQGVVFVCKECHKEKDECGCSHYDEDSQQYMTDRILGRGLYACVSSYWRVSEASLIALDDAAFWRPSRPVRRTFDVLMEGLRAGGV